MFSIYLNFGQIFYLSHPVALIFSFKSYLGVYIKLAFNAHLQIIVLLSHFLPFLKIQLKILNAAHILVLES